MKPLTIEELKALQDGDYIYILDEKGGLYCQLCDPNDEVNYWNRTDERLNVNFWYSDYGTKWLAYKNKEQANGELEIVRNETEKELAAWILKQIKKNATDVHFTNYDECGKAVSLTVAESLMTEIKQEAERRLAELKGEV